MITTILSTIHGLLGGLASIHQFGHFMTTILSTILVLGVLIFVHELGHFLVARRMGVMVLRFSFGFGPKLYTIKRGDTEYCISLIPLGGYVKMLGEEPEEAEENKDLPDSFSSQPVFKRMAIVVAGPVSNFLLALLIFWAFSATCGVSHLLPEIGTVAPASPAERSGLHPGDRILAIDSVSLKYWEDLSKTIRRSGGKTLDLFVSRGQETLTLRVAPEISDVPNEFMEKVKTYAIGVTPSSNTVTEKVNVIEAGYYSVEETYNWSKLFLVSIVKLVEMVLPMNSLGGPIMIAQLAGQQARAGFGHLVNFIAVISVNLAVLNLLPVPILDGGHLFFFAIEAIRKKPIALKKIEMAQKVGMLLLLLLMVFVFYNDIMRLIPGGSKLPTP